MKAKSILVAGAVLVLAASSTQAYSFLGKNWTKNRTVRMHLSFTGPGFALSDGFASWDESATDALNIWNTHLAHMQFEAVHDSLLPPDSNDYDNSVLFSDSIFGDSWGSGTLAVTLISSRNGILTETDVLFNSANWNWDSYNGNLRSGAIDFHRVALHEFGHVVGLDHPDQHGQQVAAIMNSTINNLYVLQADDIAGGQSLYASGPAYLSGGTPANLINISTRGRIGTADNVLIGGFIIQGSEPATVILRSLGHSLAAVGLANAIDDPVMELHDSSGALMASNDDWISSSDAETIASYGFDPPNSLESAMIATLNPGLYTVIVKGYADFSTPPATGIGLFELFDMRLTTNSRAGNISTRGQVLLNDEVMIGGFILAGQSRDLIVRALGPSLTALNVSGALSDPFLELHDAQGTLMATNDDWGQGPDAATIQNRGFAPSSPKESALFATLNPGLFTAIVRGVNNTTGIALVEVFDLSAPPP
jgi:hypothetical protein